MRQIRVVVEHADDGYIAYPRNQGAVVGQGDSYEEVLADVRSALAFHAETLGAEALDVDSPVLEAFVAEAGTSTPPTLPNHALITGSTLRTICTQAGIRRDEFSKAYDQSWLVRAQEYGRGRRPR